MATNEQNPNYQRAPSTDVQMRCLGTGLYGGVCGGDPGKGLRRKSGWVNGYCSRRSHSSCGEDGSGCAGMKDGGEPVVWAVKTGGILR